MPNGCDFSGWSSDEKQLNYFTLAKLSNHERTIQPIKNLWDFSLERKSTNIIDDREYSVRVNVHHTYALTKLIFPSLQIGENAIK